MQCGSKDDEGSTKSGSQIMADGENRLLLPLNDMESGMLVLMHSSVSTANFFSAEGVDYDTSLTMLKSRVKLICKANPWMVGQLVKNKKIHKRLLCSFPKTVSDADIDAIISASPITTTKPINDLSSSSSSSYNDIIDKLNEMEAFLKPGCFRINKKDERVTKFMFMPVGENGNEYLLLFSLCHCLGDGATYYSLLSMLRDGAEIKSLDMERIHKEQHDVAASECVSVEERYLMDNKSLLFNVFWRKAFLPTLSVAISYIDQKKISQIKAAAKSRHPDDPDFFISTNDIITSTFATETDSEAMVMLMDLRGRHPNVKRSLAGNYEMFIFYDRESKTKPEDIRSSLQRLPIMRISGKPLPTWREMLFMDLSAITSWVFPSFDADLHLWDSKGKPGPMMKLHLPAIDPKNVIPCPSVIVFKPSKGEVAIMCWYQSSSRDDDNDDKKKNYYERMVASGTLLGEKMF
eukprot:scaffold3410_cov141-Cylindrotheca_fusiformis.AAC.17